METLAGKPDVTWWLLKLLTARLQLVDEEASCSQISVGA
jgi:hypothetical protein